MLSQCLESSKNTRGAIACLFLSTDTYWYSDLPAIVPEDEMDSLLDAVETDAFSPNPGTNHVKEDIQDLLTKIRRWYKKDVNGMPPVYVLQPPYLHQTSKDSVTSESQGSESLFEEVSVIRKALFDASVRAGAPEHEVSKWLSSNAEKDWRFTQLFTSIRSSQDSASQRKKPSKSKTQAQLRDAVLPVIRDLEGLREDAFKLEGRGFSEDNTGAKKKIESTLSEKEQMVRKYWTISKQRRRLLYELRNQMRTQNGKRTLNFQAPWKAMGMELGHPDHARYVRELGASFVVLMESRLERGGARNQQQIQETPSDFKCCWCCRGQSNVAWGGSTWEHMHGWEAEAALHAVFASKEADGYVNLPALINEEGDSIRDPAQQLMGLINDRILQSTSEVGEARDDDTPKGLPILLYGPSSTGKTATMCHVATKLLHPPEATQQQSDESYESGSPKSFSNPVVVFRSVGATFGTLSVTSLVQGICLQIRRAYGKDRGKFQSTGLVDTLVGDDAPTPKLLRTHFSEALALATEECPLVVFLDGLDLLGSENISPNKPGQGAETGESMAANYPWTWLPYRVPKNVCLVISMRDFVEVRQTSNTSRKPTAARPSRIFHTTMGWYGLDPQRDAVRLCSLNPVTAQYLLLALLRQQKRILQPFQIDAIWQEHTSESGRSTPASPASHNTNFSPSAGYVRILASVASKWRSWDHWESNHSTHSKLFPPSPQLQLFLDAIFDDVEEEHGKRLVQSVLGLLLTARLGLRHSELCDIISGDDDTLGYPGIPDTVFDKMECTQPKGGKIQSEVETKIKARRLPPIALSCLLDELVGLGLVDARIVDPDKNANGCAEHFVPSHHDCLKVFMQMRYLPTPKSEMHYSQMLAEYFSGELSEKFKARLLHPQSWRFSEDRVEEYGINSTDAGGDEGDQKRPRRHSLHCRHKGGKGKANIRRLTELPRALRKSQLYTKAMDMFSNFEMWEAAFEADSRRFSCSNRTDGSHQLDGQNSKSIVTDLLNEMRKLLQDVSVMSGDKHKRIKSSENSISDKAPADEYFRLKSFQSIIERAKGFLKKYPELTLPFAANSDLQLNMESIISKISNDRISNKAQPWLKLLDKPANGLKMGEFNVKGHAILSVAWSFARPNCFAVCSNDGNVTIQNSLTKASVLQTTTGFADNVGMVRIWYPDFDLEMGDPWPSVAAIEAHGAPISSVAFCPEGERIATTSLDGSAAIWSLSPIQRMFDIRHHEGTALNCCEWSPIIDAEHRIAFAAEDGSVSIWNVEGRHPVLSNRLSGDGVGVKAIAWSPDGNTLATASSDGLLKLWDWHWSQCLCVIQAHSDAILSLDWHPSGSKIVTGSADGTVRIWSPDAIRMQVQLRRSTGSVDDDVVQGYSKEAPQVKTSVVAAAWCADHKRFVAVKSDHKVEFWDPADGSCTAQRQTLEVSDLIPLQTGALSADGKRCLSVSSAGEVIVWAPSSGEVQRRIKLENSKKVRLLNPRANISWHPKGAAIVCTVPGTELESTFVWKIASAGREETANEVPQLWFVGDPTSSAVRIQSTFSPDGTKILQLTSHGATVWSWAEEVESTPIQWMLEITGSWTLSTWSKSATSEAQRILLVEAAHPNIRIKPNMGEAIIVDGQTGNKICGLTRVLSHTFLHATGCSFTLDGQHAAVSFGMTDSYGDMHVDSEALIVLYDCVQGYALSSVGRPDLGIFGHVLVCGECQGEEETSETSVFGTGHREEDVFVFRLKRPCNEGHNIKVGAEQELEKEQLSNLLAPLVQEESDQLDGEGDDADEDGDENAAISASRWSLVQHRKQERVLQSELEELKHKVVVLEDSNEQKEKMLKQEMEVRKAREQELAKQRRAVEEEKKRKEEEVARKQEEFKKHLDEELAKRQLIEKEQEAMKQLMNALTSQLDEKDRELQKAKSKACSLL
ncbi:hypothetical protein HK102_000416 [Quaeritorhiza haematococci]|nr:hypothetical protein HK102_000416 [Quaeritorhiza haematococci]